MPSDDPDSSLVTTPASAARARKAGAALAVAVVDRVGRPVAARGLAVWLTRTTPPGVGGRVTIALVADAHMRRLNRTYRGMDYATDVLSFPADHPSPGPAAVRRSGGGARTSLSARRTPQPPFLGDIVIATGVAARQAREQGHPIATELRVLALHGLLHLLGYDHETDAGRMARVERRLRRRGLLGAGLIERQRRS